MTPPSCRHSWLVARLHEDAGRTWATYQCEYCGALSEEQPPAPASPGASWTALLCAVLVCAAALWLLLLVADRLDGVRGCP